ncbi:ATP-binding protein [Undibacterium sp. Tian12W]|uniref:ATP-binding protein n=1 Tax=Undibacterium sp. Tian12W TaxID=3413054 RepID=UPI003BF2A042
MSETGTSKRTLPVWAEQLRQKYLAGEASVFVLYGNVFDRYLVDGVAHGMSEFLSQVLLKENKNRIMEISLDRGVRFLQGATTEEKEVLYGYLADKSLPGIFESVERRMREHASNAVIFPYAGTIFPNGDPQMMSLEDRIAFTTLHRWSLDDALAQKDNVVILLCESLAEINQAIMSNPKVAAVEVPIPQEAEREIAVRHYAPKMEEQQVKLLAKQTAGLRVIQLSSIVAAEGPQGLREAERTKLIASLLQGQANAEDRAVKLSAITAGMTPEEIAHLIDPGKTLAVDVDVDPYSEMMEIVRKRKRELIEKECAGLIEFIEPKHDLSAVGGNENIKTELMEIAKAIKSGDKARSPMGLLAVGAMGAGKTFVIKAFLKEAGLSGVSLKNFRSKWVGSTEANLERVLTAVKAMGPIAVVIDEGDRSFGKQGDDSDGGTSSRVIARLKEFMSDTENRGKVLFILMTNRPDKLDTDIKRPGRLDRKIPFFYADTATERADIVKAILSRYDVKCSIDWANTLPVFDVLRGYSNADLEAVALLALEFAKRGDGEITSAIFEMAVADFMPPQETQMIAFMEMLAVFETSRRSMLPDRFKNMTPQEVQQQLQVLRNAI